GGEGRIPDLVEDAHAGAAAIFGGERLRARPEARGRLARRPVRTKKRAEALERAGHVLELALFGPVDRDAEARDAVDRLHARRIRPGEDEVGLERDHRLEVDAEAATDARQLARFFGIVAVVHRADEPRAAARGIG